MGNNENNENNENNKENNFIKKCKSSMIKY